MRSASAIFMSHTEGIMYLLQIITYVHLWKTNEPQKGFKGSAMMQAL